MASHSRILWLHERIIRGQFPSLKEFSEHFNISRRQASREINYLRNKLMAPLLYSRANRGYYYSKEFSIPSLFTSKNFNEDNERLLIERVNPNLYNVLEKSLEVKVIDMNKTVVPICVDIRKETVYSYIPEVKKIEGILLEKFDSLILTGKRFNFVYASSFDKYCGNLSKQTLRCAKVKIENTEKILLYTSETEVLEWISKNASKKPQLIDKQIKEKLRKKLILLNKLLD